MWKPFSGFEDSVWGSAANIIDKCFGEDQMDSVSKLLFLGGDTYSGGSYWDMVNGLLNIVKPFGYAFITTFFIIYMLDIASKDQLSVDSIIKTMIQLVVVVGVSGNIDKVINALLTIGESILNKFDKGSLYGASSDGATFSGEIAVQQAKDNGEGCFSFSLMAGCCWFIHQIAIMAVDAAAISRAIEVGWRCAFAPIGIANSFEGGASSAGVRYLKALAASILAGAALWAICAIGFALSAGFLVSTESMAKLLVAQAGILATAGAAIGASAKIKDIVG